MPNGNSRYRRPQLGSLGLAVVFFCLLAAFPAYAAYQACDVGTYWNGSECAQCHPFCERCIGYDRSCMSNDGRAGQCNPKAPFYAYRLDLGCTQGGKQSQSLSHCLSSSNVTIPGKNGYNGYSLISCNSCLEDYTRSSEQHWSDGTPYYTCNKKH